jgi:hypothetical protein
MARTTFDQDIFVAAPPTITRERLAKLMTTITEMHPFVVWAQHVQTTTSPDGTPVDHYLVRDHMKLGPFPIAFTYKVDTTVNPDGTIISNAYQSPGIHLHNTTWCEPAGNGTRIREHIEITAPCPLMKVTYNGAASSHKEMFAKFKQLAEQGQTSTN